MRSVSVSVPLWSVPVLVQSSPAQFSSVQFHFGSVQFRFSSVPLRFSSVQLFSSVLSFSILVQFRFTSVQSCSVLVQFSCSVPFRSGSVQSSPVQFSLVSMSSEKPTCPPPHPRQVLTLPLKQFQSSPNWLMMALSRPFQEDCQGLPLFKPLSSPLTRSKVI